MVSVQIITKYFWYIFGVMGIVFFWAGVLDGLGNLSYLVNPLISLFVGLAMLTLGGYLFRDTGMFGKADKRHSMLHKVHTHPKKHEFIISYHDRIKKKEISFPAHKLQDIEKGFLVLLEGKKELFVPSKRVTKILHNGEVYWKHG